MWNSTRNSNSISNYKSYVEWKWKQYSMECVALLSFLYCSANFSYAREEKCSMNIHLLSHLAQCVKSWGPVWCYSCFPFESRNADLKRIFHGSRDMSKQVSGFYLCIYMQVQHCLNTTDGILFCMDTNNSEKCSEKYCCKNSTECAAGS